MSNKRGRYPNTLAPGQVDPATQVRIPALVEELRAATTKVEDDVQQKRARLLEDTLNEMSPDMEARFEFYMRSHFNYRNVKKILQKEIECATRDVMTSAHASEDQVQFNSTYSGGSARPIYGAPTVSDDMAIVVCGLAKLYVGELVDIAKDVMMERLAASAEDGVPRPPPQAVVANAEDGSNHQSAFNMIASLGAAVTNEILQLTRADIDEASRRMSDKGQHARDISGQSTVPLFCSQSQATGSTRFSSVASIMTSSTEGRGGGDMWYGADLETSGEDEDDEDEDDGEGGDGGKGRGEKEEGGGDSTTTATTVRDMHGLKVHPLQRVFNAQDEVTLLQQVEAYNQRVLTREVSERAGYGEFLAAEEQREAEAAAVAAAKVTAAAAAGTQAQPAQPPSRQ